jgi:hypothetical protein
MPSNGGTQARLALVPFVRPILARLRARIGARLRPIADSSLDVVNALIIGPSVVVTLDSRQCGGRWFLNGATDLTRGVLESL